MYFRLPTDVAELGYGYGCVGLRIRLNWVTQTAASGYADGCIGLRIWLNWVTQTAVLAD